MKSDEERTALDGAFGEVGDSASLVLLVAVAGDNRPFADFAVTGVVAVGEGANADGVMGELMARGLGAALPPRLPYSNSRGKGRVNVDRCRGMNA